MKKSILFFLIIFISKFSFSQITVTDINLLDIGDVINLAEDDISVVNIGTAAQNQIWDFSSLQETDTYKLSVLSVNGTPFDQLYPGANICIEDEGDFIYCNKSTSGISMLGIGDSVFQGSMMLCPLPLSYGLSSTDGPALLLDSIIGGPMVNVLLTSQGLSASLLTFGAAHVADSLSIQVEMTTIFDVDAEGTLILPIGSFDALRVQIDRTTISNINVYCIDTNSGMNSGWYSLPFGSSEVERTYQWFSNDIQAKFILAEIALDTIGGSPNGVTYLTNGSSTNLDVKKVKNFIIYPVPSNYDITIESMSNNNVEAVLTDINGKDIIHFNFYNKYTVNLDHLSKGTYLLNLNDGENISSKKIIIK